MAADVRQFATDFLKLIKHPIVDARRMLTEIGKATSTAGKTAYCKSMWEFYLRSRAAATIENFDFAVVAWAWESYIAAVDQEADGWDTEQKRTKVQEVTVEFLADLLQHHEDLNVDGPTRERIEALRDNLEGPANARSGRAFVTSIKDVWEVVNAILGSLPGAWYGVALSAAMTRQATEMCNHEGSLVLD